MLTNEIIMEAEICHDKVTGNCPGDSGEVMCIFCPCCVLSFDEVLHVISRARTSIVGDSE